MLWPQTSPPLSSSDQNSHAWSCQDDPLYILQYNRTRTGTIQVYINVWFGLRKNAVFKCFANFASPVLSWVPLRWCADLVPGDFGKYSKSKSHETQIFRISPLLLPNFLGGIIFPSVSALYSHLGRRRNFQPNSSQDGHCCKFLGGEF